MKLKNETLKFAFTIIMVNALLMMLVYNIFSNDVLLIGGIIGTIMIWVGIETVIDLLKNLVKKN